VMRSGRARGCRTGSPGTQSAREACHHRVVDTSQSQRSGTWGVGVFHPTPVQMSILLPSGSRSTSRAPSRDYLSPGEALDRLLADPTFIQQLAANPRARWTGADLAWDDERWTMELRLQDPDEALVATIDAITGAVTDIQLIARDPES